VTAPRQSGLLNTVSIVLLAAYPLAVYVLVERGGLRLAGLVLLAAVALRALSPGAVQGPALAALGMGAAFAAGITLGGSEVLARLYPVAVSAALLAAFGATLLRPPSMVERIARAGGGELDAAAVRYTRTLTAGWCGFFCLSGCVALGTALLGSREAWTLYNGLVSYLLVGALLAGERIVRPTLRRRLAESALR